MTIDNASIEIIKESVRELGISFSTDYSAEFLPCVIIHNPYVASATSEQVKYYDESVAMAIVINDYLHNREFVAHTDAVVAAIKAVPLLTLGSYGSGGRIRWRVERFYGEDIYKRFGCAEIEIAKILFHGNCHCRDRDIPAEDIGGLARGGTNVYLV